MKQSGNSIVIYSTDASYCRVLSKVLLKAHYSVRLVSKYDDIRQLLTTNGISLVIYDLHLPNSVQISLMRQIIEHTGKAKVLVITNFIERELFEMARQMGAVDCLAKPIKRDKILDTVNRALKDSHHEWLGY